MSDQGLAWWSKILQETPGFLYGFFIGFLGSFLANGVYEKFLSQRKDNSIKLEITKHGAKFTGDMNTGNAEHISAIMMAAATKSSNPNSKGSSYKPSHTNVKTNNQQ